MKSCVDDGLVVPHLALCFSFAAITFVTLGTSLPDTFASKAAAVGEKTADNAIGNVTGSNSVNVFLGLGLPWTIAAIYHYANVSSSQAHCLFPDMSNRPVPPNDFSLGIDHRYL